MGQYGIFIQIINRHCILSIMTTPIMSNTHVGFLSFIYRKKKDIECSLNTQETPSIEETSIPEYFLFLFITNRQCKQYIQNSSFWEILAHLLLIMTCSHVSLSNLFFIQISLAFLL